MGQHSATVSIKKHNLKNKKLHICFNPFIGYGHDSTGYGGHHSGYGNTGVGKDGKLHVITFISLESCETQAILFTDIADIIGMLVGPLAAGLFLAAALATILNQTATATTATGTATGGTGRRRRREAQNNEDFIGQALDKLWE